jgi:hypothetical protein
VIIDLRIPEGGKRGREQSIAAVAAAMHAATDGTLSAGDTRIAADWIQYRNNFRDVVALRTIEDDRARLSSELAIDLRRVKADEFEAELTAALTVKGEGRGVYLEPWVSMKNSCVWDFNSLYWQELALWEEASGHLYAEALPGGESKGTELTATHQTLNELFAVWDSLVERQALPEQLTVLEIGVGSGEQAKVWLDEFLKLDRARGTDYYRRLNYLMGDYSTHVLARAREVAADHKSRVSSLVLDASHPMETLRFLEQNIFFVYISNVYDNLPTDELAVIDDTFYLVQARAFLPHEDAERLAKTVGISVSGLGELVGRLLKLAPGLLAQASPDLFKDTAAATTFWVDVWGAARFEERYVPLGPLDLYEICEGATGELLAPLIDGYGDLRFQVSNGAIQSLVETLPLLHPLGWLTCHDLFTTELGQYRTGFKGPGKYDGSVVNWVNGPVMRSIASRRGLQLEFSSIDPTSPSPVLTATARARD